jgi:DNA-binding winged helix-turn-helix (wHTH) protein/tetratricopeptide (TPR) repeat protein
MHANVTQSGKQSYEFGPFRLDPDKQTLLRDGQPIPLTPKAFQLLLVLLRHKNEVVTKDELMKSVWPDTFVEETNLTRNIFALRKALGESEHDRYIVTVPGQGYRLAGDVQEFPEREVSIVSATSSTVQLRVEEKGFWRWILLSAAVILVVAGFGIFRRYGRPKPLLTEKDTVVLADFANSTGDPVFDDTLRQGLAVQLEQSPFLGLASDDRIHRSLKMMGKPPDTKLAAGIAQEVCERTGATTLVEGSVTMLGGEYVLSLRAKNCHTGDVLADEQEQVPKKEDVLNALGRMANRFRSRVGESLPSVQKYSTPITEATTPSLEALKAYSAGWQVHAVHGASASLPLFQRAAEIDPQFAMAHASLGRIYADLDQPELAAASTLKAWQLRDRVSDPEKFFITVNYQMLVTGNLESAQQTCEAWSRTYPREARSHHMLSGMIHKTPGRYEKALAEAQKAIELEPDFWVGYYNLGVANLYLGRPEQAESALSAAAARGLDSDEFIMLAYDIAFLKGDKAGMEREAARARAHPGGENWISARDAFVAAYSGRLQDARAISHRAVIQAQQVGQPERAALWETGSAVREALFGDNAAARERALSALKLSHDSEVEYGSAFALGMCGDSSHAQALADDLQKRFPEDTSVRFSYLPVLRALLALKHAQPEHAMEVLQVAAQHELGLPRSTVSGLFGALYPVYLRGQAYLASQKGREAAAEFQKVLEHRGIVINDPIGALTRLQLGRAYAMDGDTGKARDAYQDFLALWKDADPGIPILKQAKIEYAKLQ